MITIALIGIIIFMFGLRFGFWPKHNWPTGNVTITVKDRPWYLYWNSNTWWYLNMDNCYGMTPHDWVKRYTMRENKHGKYTFKKYIMKKGEYVAINQNYDVIFDKGKSSDTGICRKCGKTWGFGTR